MNKVYIEGDRWLISSEDPEYVHIDFGEGIVRVGLNLNEARQLWGQLGSALEQMTDD